MAKFLNRTGLKYGKLTAVESMGKNKNGLYLWKCICDCGKEKTVIGISLGIRVNSCGCIRNPEKNEYLKTLEERLLKYSKINRLNGCREWQVENRKTSFGYGFINIKSKQIMAHRASWLVWKGEIPEGKFICHKCDNPSCINPEHLFIGTHKDNMVDMSLKKRGNIKGVGLKHGEESPQAKIEKKDVIIIRILHKKFKYNFHMLRSIYPLSYAQIANICKHRLWKCVTKDEEDNFFKYFDEKYQGNYCFIGCCFFKLGMKRSKHLWKIEEKRIYSKEY